jgi:heat shock protein HslJ
MRVLRLLVPVGCVVLVATGCSDEDSTPTMGRLDGTTFESTLVTGHDLVGGTHVRMTFEQDGISVNAGCNTLVGSASVAGERLLVGTMAQTMMACTDDLTAQDQFLAQFFESKPTISLDGRTLRLTGPDATIVADTQT